MGGFFGVASSINCVLDVFFGTDYHSYLGICRGGVAAYDSEIGLQREIHNIGNSPSSTKFEHILDHMPGTSAIGSISDRDPCCCSSALESGNLRDHDGCLHQQRRCAD